MIAAPRALLFTLFSNYVSEEAPGNYLCANTTHRERKNTLSVEVCCSRNRRTLVSMSVMDRCETAAEPEPPSAPGEPAFYPFSVCLCVYDQSRSVYTEEHPSTCAN